MRPLTLILLTFSSLWAGNSTPYPMAPKKPAKVHRFNYKKGGKAQATKKQSARLKKATPLKMGKVRPAVK